MSTLQAPIESGFSAASTAREVLAGLDLTGQIAIVTGGYSGIGLETARALRAAGARVIVPARDHAKAAAALATSAAGIELAAMDLLDPASIDDFARRFLAAGQPLHILVNSAGIMACPLARDARGYEAQFATNHLGHFQLVARLWPALRRAGGARVVAVSSWGHRYSPIVFDDLQFARRAYEPWAAYGQSKTANILFARSLDERGAAAGVRAFSLHPGTIVTTDLSRHVPADLLRKMGVLDDHGQPVIDPARGFKTVEQGAATSVWCATSPRLAGLGGVYCEDVDIAVPTPAAYLDARGNDGPRRTGAHGVLPHAVDPAAAARLWTVSEQLTGATLGDA